MHVKLLLERLGQVRSEFSKIVIVDSSDKDKFQQLRSTVETSRNILGDVELLHTEHRSLTRQKNLGLPTCLSFQAFQVLDDDVLPPAGYLKKSFELLELQNADGVSGITQEILHTRARRTWFDGVFGLRSARPGGVSASGIGTPIDPEEGTACETEWLIGCSMWRSSSVNHQYEASLTGSALFEDVIFSVKNRGNGGLWVDPSLILHHAASMEERPDSEIFWFRFAHNRLLVLRSFSRAPKWQLARGNFGATLQILFGKAPQKYKSMKGLLRGWAAVLKENN